MPLRHNYTASPTGAHVARKPGSCSLFFCCVFADAMPRSQSRARCELLMNEMQEDTAVSAPAWGEGSGSSHFFARLVVRLFSARRSCRDTWYPNLHEHPQQEDLVRVP